MLRDALAREAYLVLHGQTGAEFEESLPVAIAEFVENCAPHGRYECFEDVAHCCR